MSSESDTENVAEDEDESKLYRLIYDMGTAESRDREEKENEQIPSGSEHTPLQLEINAESTTHATVGTTKGKDMDALDNIQGIPVLNVDVGSLEERPWRKAGADISDYFNYGFDEESWSAYCKKQAKLCAAHRKLYTKTRVHKGHTRRGEKELCFADFSSGCPSTLASSLSYYLNNRASSATVDVTEGRPPSSSRVEGQHCFSGEGEYTQVFTKMCHEEDKIAFYHLTPPSNISCLFPYPTPPRVSSLSPGSLASRTGVVNTAKAREKYLWQEKCDKDRDRSREHGHGKDSKRSRDKESKSSSSSYNSGKEQLRNRDTLERGHKYRSFERVTGAGEQHLERRQKSPRSSSSNKSRREDGEEREGQSRHKRKKAKRNRKDKETNKI